MSECADWSAPETWLTVWDDNNGSYVIDPAEENGIDAAVQLWIDSNGTRDTLLHMRNAAGETVRLLASIVTGWQRSTPEARRRDAVFELARKAERMANGLADND